MIGKALKALPVDADDLIVDVDSSVNSRGASFCDRLDKDPRQLRPLANVPYGTQYSFKLQLQAIFIRSGLNKRNRDFCLSDADKAFDVHIR